MKKKPSIISNKSYDYIKNLFIKKVNYYKIADLCSPMVGILINLNKQHTELVKCLRKNDLLSDNLIYPSLAKAFNENIKIKPFWNDKIQKLSDKLFLPSHDNLCPVIDKINTFDSFTWFNTEHYTGCHYKPYKLKTKDVQIVPTKVIKCKKIKLYLTKEQCKMMKQIIGTYRYFYNRCISIFNNYDKKKKSSWYLISPNDEKSKIIIEIEGNPHNMINMRPIIKKNLPEWLLNGFPSHLLDQAIIEAFNRFNCCLDRYMRTKKPFKMKFKNKKELYQTINLEKCMINSKRNGLFVGWKLNGHNLFSTLSTSENFPKNHVGSNLTYHKVLNTFTMNINYESESTKTKSNKTCSIDQGIKCPFVVYSPDDIIEIGRNCTKKLHKVCKEIDIIKSNMDSKTYYRKCNLNDITYNKVYNVNSERRRNLRKALHRKIQYVKNLRSELHNKTIKYLTETYKTIILPPFETKEMVGSLSSDISRQMYTLSFYQFKQKLKAKCIEKGITLRSLNEPFTSKTCGKCGNLKNNLGNADVYNCEKCGLIINRDMNGARNILLRNINLI